MSSRDQILKRLKLDPDKIRRAFEEDDELPGDKPGRSESMEALRGLGSFELEGMDVTRGDGEYEITLRVVVDADELTGGGFDARWLRVNDRKFGKPIVLRENTFHREGQARREIILRTHGDEDTADELRRAPTVVVQGRLGDGRKFWGLKNLPRKG